MSRESVKVSSYRIKNNMRRVCPLCALIRKDLAMWERENILLQNKKSMRTCSKKNETNCAYEMIDAKRSREHK